MSESAYQSRLVATCAQHDLWLFRNNVGACRAADGRLVRYGLCPGSADQIGWMRYTVQPIDVGRTLAVFASVEMKARRGVLSPEQERWRDVILESGGLAVVAREPMGWNELLEEWK